MALRYYFMNKLNNVEIKLDGKVFHVVSNEGLQHSGNFRETSLFIDSLLEMRQITTKQWRQLDKDIKYLIVSHPTIK